MNLVSSFYHRCIPDLDKFWDLDTAVTTLISPEVIDNQTGKPIEVFIDN